MCISVLKNDDYIEIQTRKARDTFAKNITLDFSYTHKILCHFF